MRTFLEILTENINNEYTISHNPIDFLESNRYYVKKNDNTMILFIFDNDINGRYLKILDYVRHEYVNGSTAIYDLSEDNLKELIQNRCA